MKKINLFGSKESVGNFDDFFDINKYKNIQEAYKNDDFVKGDFFKDDNDILYIKLIHVKTNKEKLHQLSIQKCYFGLDHGDDDVAYNMAMELL